MSTEEGRWLEGLDERTERERMEAATATERLDDAECGLIVRASIDPLRKLGGRGEDILLNIVERIVAQRVARAVAEAKAEALRLVRLVESDISEAALNAWRSADARHGLSDHAALEVHADALTRWSERFRMAFDGEDYRADRERQS